MVGIDFPTTAAALGARIGAQIVGDPNREVRCLRALEFAREGSLSFLADPKYADRLPHAEGAVVVTNARLARPQDHLTLLIVEDPKSSFASVAQTLRAPASQNGISPLASIGAGCEIDPTVSIGPYACIGDGVRIGPRTRLGPLVVLGNGVQIGSDCDLHPQVVLYERIQLGNRITIHAGTIIGGDGFGYFRAGGNGPYVQMPHLGTVIIEDDVRLGSNSTVDRGTLSDTRIGQGTKTDDQAHIGHNVRIGKDNIICAQTALGGSAVLADDVMLGGQSAIGPGCTVGQGARMGGQSGTTINVPANDTYMFNPPIPIKDFTRIYRGMRNLPELFKRVRRIEAQIGARPEEGDTKDG
ncbi:UDP-3-O-(3-hydroxymyristoyl)glucosamine N-acyltransferase [bacterium]|nr:UDP-3-O-(3-hydroxymyristoyl)glucosamine N-acyltransferase [bacterium]